MTPSPLVVGCTSITPWGHDQLAGIAEQARLRGLRLVGMDLPERLERSSETVPFDELVAVDVDDGDAGATAVAGRTDIAAVLTIRELSVAPVAAIARSLGLRGNAASRASACRSYGPRTSSRRPSAAPIAASSF